MASNSFGTLFRITTWGESHGKAVGVVIDGCPAGLDLCDQDINDELFWRAPGNSSYTSPRHEPDIAEILSGIFEGKTTGAPLCIMIPNKDVDSSSYEEVKYLVRPGHAQYTYLQKYGIFDYRGGGRASARETASRVAAGAVAKKILKYQGIRVEAFIRQIGDIVATHFDQDVHASPVFCPDSKASASMMQCLDMLKEDGDSIGGIVECIAHNVEIGLGDPIYEKLEANLAKAMLSIPASKGFEIGLGFQAVTMKGSQHNDIFLQKFLTNNAGGILGGISTGMPIVCKVAFKPTSSITKPQLTSTLSGEEAPFSLSKNARHDPCVAIRGVFVVEAMMSLVLVDALLHNRSSRL